MLKGYMTLIRKKFSSADTYPGYPVQVLEGTRLRIGATLELDQTPFIINEDKLRLTFPGSKHSVWAIASLNISGLEKPVVRVYLKPYSPDLGGEEAFLQLIRQDDGGLETLLFVTSARIHPPNADEWAAWLDEENGIIGSYYLTPPDGPAYVREWLAENQERTQPVPAWESIYTVNAETAPSQSRSHQMMLYSRDLGLDFDEYILVSAVRENQSAFVDIHTGIPVDLSGMTII